MRPAFWFGVVWLGWLISWIAAAFWSERNEKRLFNSQVFAYRVLIAAGVVLSLHQTAHWFGARRLWHVGYSGAYALVVLTLAGILFAWWARIHIGREWASGVARKKDHQIVDTGPYRIVRHPIYTGLLGAALATTVAQATITALLGWLLILLGLWIKARAEEAFLVQELEPDTYANYRRGVPMLLPFV